jgi:hypothetical protein
MVRGRSRTFVAFLTFGANTIVVGPLSHQIVSRGVRNAIKGNILYLEHVHILSGTASETNEVGVGVGPESVIAVWGAAEFKFENLTGFLENLDGVVDGSEAGGGVYAANFGVNLVDGGMAVGGRKRLQYLRASGGYIYTQLRHGSAHLVYTMLNLRVQNHLLT